MPEVQFEFDPDGVVEILSGADVQLIMSDAAKGIVAEIEAAHPDLPVEHSAYVARPGSGIRDGRTLQSVAIRDVRGMVYQTRDGLMTRAAANQGLEVRGKP